MSVRIFGGNDSFFLRCCELAKIPPTYRQRKKWERAEGSAYKKRAAANLLIAAEKESELQARIKSLTS